MMPQVLDQHTEQQAETEIDLNQSSPHFVLFDDNNYGNNQKAPTNPQPKPETNISYQQANPVESPDLLSFMAGLDEHIPPSIPQAPRNGSSQRAKQPLSPFPVFSGSLSRSRRTDENSEPIELTDSTPKPSNERVQSRPTQALPRGIPDVLKQDDSKQDLLQCPICEKYVNSSSELR